MAPCQAMTQPTRTEEYKKVLKPLLERRRRARINHCLDQLKELLVEAVSMEGESAAKLEKADVLELAVQHLQRLRGQRRTPAVAREPQQEMDRFRAGFSAAATVVSRVLAHTPGVDVQFGTRIMQHLGTSYRALDQQRLTSPLAVEVPQYRSRVPSISSSCVSPTESCSSGYSSGGEGCGSSTGLLTTVQSPLNLKVGDENVWRPW